MATQARQRLLESARELFSAQGIRAVSVEQLLEASEVGRASFYRHFESKDALVAATLDDYNKRWRVMLREQVPARGQGILGVFDILAERMAEPDYRGCLALTALVEFRDPDHPIHQAAARHQKTTATDLAVLLDQSIPKAERAILSRQLLQLIDATLITGLYDTSSKPALDARETAAALLSRNSD